MPFEAISPAGFPKPIAPYSAGAKADNVIYTAGVLPLDDGGLVHPGDAAGQTRYVLDAVSAILQAAGGTMADVTFNHVFLADWSDYAAINTVYAEYFPGVKPARYCVQVGLARPGCLVEIASIAHVGR